MGGRLPNLLGKKSNKRGKGVRLLLYAFITVIVCRFRIESVHFLTVILKYI